METGDLVGSGTILGLDKDGSLLERACGLEPLTLKAGEGRTFIEGGYELTLAGRAQGPDYRNGFGECVGRILPAATDFVARLAEGDVCD